MRKGLRVPLVEFSVDHPLWVMVITGLLSLAALTQFPKVKTDTNPKNMLPETSDVRVFNDEVERTFGLYEDMIVLGIVNENGLLNKDTLGKVHRITSEILKLRGVAARDVASIVTIDNVTVDGGMLPERVTPLTRNPPVRPNSAEIGAMAVTSTAAVASVEVPGQGRRPLALHPGYQARDPHRGQG